MVPTSLRLLTEEEFKTATIDVEQPELDEMETALTSVETHLQNEADTARTFEEQRYKGLPSYIPLHRRHADGWPHRPEDGHLHHFLPPGERLTRMCPLPPPRTARTTLSMSAGDVTWDEICFKIMGILERSPSSIVDTRPSQVAIQDFLDRVSHILVDRPLEDPEDLDTAAKIAWSGTN